MQIILKSRFQFPHWVMKMFCFQRLLQYSNLFTFPGLKKNKLFLDLALLASRRLLLQHVFSARFPGAVPLVWDDVLIQRHFQRLITGKLTGVDPGRPQNLQRRKVEVTRGPKLFDKTTNSNQQWIQEERQKQHSNHHGGLHMTEQFKLVTNAQERKIFKSNVTAIKIKGSYNFPRRYSVEITNTSLE